MVTPSRPRLCQCRRLSYEGSACPLRRCVQVMHVVLLFRPSPKWGMNPLRDAIYTMSYVELDRSQVFTAMFNSREL
jgi:hypothetical protein